MSSIQASLLSKPLPLAATAGGGHMKQKVSADDPEKVAKDFESVFASMMLKEMRNTLEPGSLFGDDQSDVYGGMFDQFIGQHMTEAGGGIGLARMISEAIKRAEHAEKQAEQATGGLSAMPTTNMTSRSV